MRRSSSADHHLARHGREPLVPMHRVLTNLPAQPKRFSHNTRTSPDQSATADAGPNALHWLGGLK